MSQKHVVILGTGGAARECYWIVREMMHSRDDIGFKGFLDFEGHRGELRNLEEFRLGDDSIWTSDYGDVLAIGIGSPELRARAYKKWKDRGATFFSLIHPGASINPEVSMGEANIFTCGCYVSCDVAIGHANYFNGNVVISHDTVIGDANFFGPFSLLLGNVTIGSGNSLGARSVALPHARIGNDNVIAPGAYLYKGCSHKKMMAGNPALVIHDLTPPPGAPRGEGPE